MRIIKPIIQLISNFQIMKQMTIPHFIQHLLVMVRWITWLLKQMVLFFVQEDG